MNPFQQEDFQYYEESQKRLSTQTLMVFFNNLRSEIVECYLSSSAQVLFSLKLLRFFVYKVEQDLKRDSLPTSKMGLFMTAAIGKVIFVG